MTDAKTTAQGTRSAANVWTDDERAAMQEATRERKRHARRDPAAERAAGEQEVLEKIASLADHDRAIAERLHAVITAAAPDLAPRTWYGSPAYYLDGTLICFFQETAKFKTRYVSLGFSDKAHLDEGNVWPVGYAVLALTRADEERIAALVKQAVS
jgi:hypothetical protein